MSAPNLKEIEWAISELEGEESSKSGYALLAALYTCRNEMMGASARAAAPEPVAYSEAAPIQETLDQHGKSDFLQAVAGKKPSDVWPVMDELMDMLYVINKRCYESVMRKLERL